MRGLRSTLVLLVVAVGLGAYIWFVERHREPASAPTPNEQLFSFDADEVTELEVRAEGGDLTTLQQADGAWRVVSPIDSAADDVAATALAATLSSLEISRVLEEGPLDLAPFGLDAPSVEVAVGVASDSGRQRLLVGDETPTGADRYAKLAASDRVFLIASHHRTALDKTTFDLRDKRLLDFDRDALERIEVVSGEHRIAFAKDGGDWRLAAPLDAAADFGAVEGLLGALGSGRMRAVTRESADDLAPFGLDAPTHSVALQAGSLAATLDVGAETDDGTYYARDAARPLVFTVDSTLVGNLERGADEYRRKALFAFRAFNASRLEVEHGGEVVAFEKREPAAEADADDAAADGEATWERVAPAAGSVPHDAMDDLLTTISGLRAESFVASRAEAGLGAQQVAATVRARFGDDDREEQVVIWRAGDETFAISGDEPGAGRIDTQAFDDALAALAEARDPAEPEPDATEDEADPGA